MNYGPPSALILPEPAIDPLQDVGGLGPGQTGAAGEPVNDQTPLLAASTSYSAEPASAAATTNSYSRTPLNKILNTYGGASVELQGLNSPSNVPLQNISHATTEKEFVEWLNKELNKIDAFYKEKEDEAISRYLILQDQLFELAEAKEREPKPENTVNKKLRHSQLNTFDWPSLPTFKFTREPRSHHKTKADRKDYVQAKKQKVPYLTARKQLKLAIQHFYRSLELLKSYRMLNSTGFRKLLKKFDKQTHSNLSSSYMKKVNESYFGSSDIVDNLLPKVEDQFSLNFENGNRKVAIEKLRVNINENQFYPTMFFSGLFFGIAIPLFAYTMYLADVKILSHTIPGGKHLFQIWAGFFFPVFFSCLFAICCFIWHKNKINYPFIFEFNPRTALDYREYPFLPSLLMLILTIFGWFSFNDFWPTVIPATQWPWFFLGSVLIIMVIPFNVLFLESRRWLVITFTRLVLSGFYPVEFRDFSLGDIFCSLTYTMGNISFYFCMYQTHWKESTTCGSSNSRLMGFFAALPSIWRFLQCFRRYADTGDWFPHLANMVKYGITTLYYVLLSVWRIHRMQSNRIVFIVVAIINSVYTGLWDILMDWSLLQNSKLLRDDITFHESFYYFGIVFDILIRFQWVFYALFTKEIQQSALTSGLIALAEILRRFVWVIIRMENEHVANQHLYRASREPPLPYPTAKQSRISHTRWSNSQTSLSAAEGAIEEEQQERSNATGRFPKRYDEEAQPFEPINSFDGYRNSFSSIKRRNTISNSQIFKTVSHAIVNAHQKDFQRRAKNPDNEDHNSSDENTDDDAD